jgi:tricorn protease
VADRESGIYALALSKEGPDLFPPRSDEVKITPPAEEAKKADMGKGGKGKEAKPKAEEAKAEKVAVKIDFDGLADRVIRVPVDFENYAGVVALDGSLLYAQGDPFYYGRPGPSGGLQLKLFSLEDRESKDFADHVQGVAVSEDGSKALLLQGGGYKLYATKPGDEPKPVSTAGLETTVDPKAEWAEIFDEVWRRYRDYFYVPNMNGYDWKALHDRYATLLEYVGHRSDLNYVISEMIAELNNSHAYITGGDWQMPKRPDVALPGAWFELDPAAGRYRISRILHGQEEEPKYRSPMDRVGLNLHVGDYVLAIDGEALGPKDNPYEHLRYKADRPVELTVSSKPNFDGARKVTYDPITDEKSLIYLAMVDENRAKVDKATGGRVGYIHIPDMGADGIWEWLKGFYGQIRKDGLIIDVRDNGGGNVSSMILERLSRQLLALGWSRNSEFPTTYPSTVFRGHLVCLVNHDSASDGDIFPAMFKQAGLGPLIGERTWGGVTGITDHGPLIDGGTVFVPEFGFLSKEGKWIIEGWGVEPDIPVTNDPKSVIEGKDPQLEKGIQEVMKEIQEDPRPFPPKPAPPIRTPGHNPPPIH